MNNISKLLDDGTLNIKKINTNTKTKKKTYKKYLKGNTINPKKTFRNKNKKHSPKIIIRKENKETKRENNKDKLLNRVIDVKIDEIVNGDDKKDDVKIDDVKIDDVKIDDDNKDEEEKLIEGTIDYDKVEEIENKKDEKKKKKKKKKNKNKNKTKTKIKINKNTDEMITELKDKGILVSGKNKRILKDIYIYALDDNIKIYRE